MISTYQGKPLGQGAMMVFTESELDKLKQEELRPLCHEEGGKYLCRIRKNGKLVSKNKHDTIEACNKQFDRHMVLHGTIYKPKAPKPSKKGYSVRNDRMGNAFGYQARILINGKQERVGLIVKTKEEARELYLKRFDEVYDTNLSEAAS